MKYAADSIWTMLSKYSNIIWNIPRRLTTPLLSCVALKPLSTILNQTTLGYIYIHRIHIYIYGQRLNHLLHTNDLKLYVKTGNELKALVNTVDIFCKDISMKSGIIKCEKVIVDRDKLEPAEVIPTTTGKITDVETDYRYKYLWELQTNKNIPNKRSNKHIYI